MANYSICRKYCEYVAKLEARIKQLEETEEAYFVENNNGGYVNWGHEEALKPEPEEEEDA